MKVVIPISVGELLDKISILRIKERYSENEYIRKELNDLVRIAKDLNVFYFSYIMELTTVNQVLWDIEDELRNLEKLQDFGERFVKLARKVYITNDKRAEIKKKINEETESNYREIKIYE
jgi:hypothetical protein